MFISESIHNVTKVEIEKRSLGGDPDSVILDIVVTFESSSYDSAPGVLVTKELALFLNEKYVLDIPEDALL
jgi:uncharacterized membrane protein|tara:strand:- start:3975 stop:4187 length:213 start_codon:yes stop_codon:yes gene_type:complete